MAKNKSGTDQAAETTPASEQTPINASTFCTIKGLNKGILARLNHIAIVHEKGEQHTEAEWQTIYEEEMNRPS